MGTLPKSSLYLPIFAVVVVCCFANAKKEIYVTMTTADEMTCSSIDPVPSCPDFQTILFGCNGGSTLLETVCVSQTTDDYPPNEEKRTRFRLSKYSGSSHCVSDPLPRCPTTTPTETNCRDASRTWSEVSIECVDERTACVFNKRGLFVKGEDGANEEFSEEELGEPNMNVLIYEGCENNPIAVIAGNEGKKVIVYSHGDKAELTSKCYKTTAKAMPIFKIRDGFAFAPSQNLLVKSFDQNVTVTFNMACGGLCQPQNGRCKP